MKHTFYHLIIIIGLAATLVPQSLAFKEESSSIDLSSHQEVIITAYGLSCPLCANNLDGQLTKIDGVESAVIDLASGSIVIGLADKHSVKAKQLIEAVDNAGFTLKNIEPTQSKP